jgi:para-aminobenzoate synthetase component 1
MSHPDISLFKSKALQWANSFDICCCLDSNSYSDPFGKFDFVIAAGATQILNIPTGQAFEALRSFYDLHKTWMFGLFSYDLKNEQEQLYSRNPDGLHFPELFFFAPKHLITIKDDQVVVLLGNQQILECFSGIRSLQKMQLLFPSGHIQNYNEKASLYVSQPVCCNGL